MLGPVIIINFWQPVNLSFSEAQRVFRMLPPRIIYREPLLAMQCAPVGRVGLIEQSFQFFTASAVGHEPATIHQSVLNLQAARGGHQYSASTLAAITANPSAGVRATRVNDRVEPPRHRR